MTKYREPPLQRLRNFILAPRRLPGWIALLVAVVCFIPDWKARLDFWIDLYSAHSSVLQTLSPVLTSPYLGFGLLAIGITYLYFFRAVIHIHNHSATDTIHAASAVATTGSESDGISNEKPTALRDDHQSVLPKIDWKAPFAAINAFGAPSLLQDRLELIKECEEAQSRELAYKNRLGELNRSRRDFNSVQRAQPAIDECQAQMRRAQSDFGARASRLRDISIALEGQIVGELGIGTLVAKGFPIQTDKWRETWIERSLWRDLTIDFLKMTANRKFDGSVMFTSVVIGRPPQETESYIPPLDSPVSRQG